MPQSLYFIAIIPPIALQDQIRQLQAELSERFESSAALKSPPHITLIPPFDCNPLHLDTLIDSLDEVARSFQPIPIVLDNFAVFAPKVLYIHVAPAPELIALKSNLKASLLARSEFQKSFTNDRHSYPFVPHITIAFRDLTPSHFESAWLEFQERSFQAKFLAHSFSLLVHNGQCWEVHSSFEKG